jgi:hypothetical protein
MPFCFHKCIAHSVLDEVPEWGPWWVSQDDLHVGEAFLQFAGDSSYGASSASWHNKAIQGALWEYFFCRNVVVHQLIIGVVELVTVECTDIIYIFYYLCLRASTSAYLQKCFSSTMDTGLTFTISAPIKMIFRWLNQLVPSISSWLYFSSARSSGRNSLVLNP